METQKEKSYLYYLGTERDRLVQALEAEVDTETGEVTDLFGDIYTAIQLLDGKAQEKAVTAGSMVLELGARIDQFKQAEARLAERRKELQAQQETLKNALAAFMNKFGIEKADGMCRLSFRKSTAVDITCPEAIPMEYMRVKYEPDKTAISKALKAGEDIPGAQLTEKKNLQIK